MLWTANSGTGQAGQIAVWELGETKKFVLLWCFEVLLVVRNCVFSRCHMRIWNFRTAT